MNGSDSSVTIFTNKLLSIVQDRGRVTVEHPGSVIILPLKPATVDTNPTIIILKHFRKAIDQTIWELPAGTRDKEFEAPELCAAREVREETGYTGRISFLCEFFNSPGYTTERSSAWLATNLEFAGQKLQGDEKHEIAVEELPFQEALKFIQDGTITDGKTAITILHFAQFHLKNYARRFPCSPDS